MKKMKIVLIAVFMLAIGSAFISSPNHKFVRTYYYKVQGDPTCYDNPSVICSGGSSTCTFTDPSSGNLATTYYSDNNTRCQLILKTKTP